MLVLLLFRGGGGGSLPPVGPQPAGRHRKRYSVRFGSRTVYYPTRAEAQAARVQHMESGLLDAQAAGLPLKRIRVRLRKGIGPVVTVKVAPVRPVIARQQGKRPDIAGAVREATERERDKKLAAADEEDLMIAVILSIGG